MFILPDIEPTVLPNEVIYELKFPNELVLLFIYIVSAKFQETRIRNKAKVTPIPVHLTMFLTSHALSLFMISISIPKK